MSIEILNSIKKANNFIKEKKIKAKKIALVPTMGALHEGHLSIVKKAKKDADVVVVSIFVNPTQFGANEDLSKYPRTFKEDKEALESLGVDAIFLPTEAMMYPPNYNTFVTVQNISNILCGITRPTHFRGVATVVLKLFNIIKPDIAYFGEKDYQQSVIIKTLVSDLNLDVIIKTVPIVREKSGLALSSRNLYLNEREREDAPMIQQALKKAKESFKSGEITNTATLIEEIKKYLSNGKTLMLDYVDVVDSETLSHLDTATKHSHILIACYCGKTRLIDNISLK